MSAAAEQPQPLETLYQQGQRALQREALSEAIAIFERALGQYPDTPLLYQALGNALLQAERPTESMRCFARAEALRTQAANWPAVSLQEKHKLPGTQRLHKKLQHDCDYLRFLLQQPAAQRPANTLLETMLHEGLQLDRQLSQIPLQALDLALSQDLDDFFERCALRFPLLPWRGPLIQMADPQRCEAEFYDGPAQFVVLDDLLSAGALQQIRHFALFNNGLWRNYAHGENYICAYPQDGLIQPFIFRLAQALRSALPGIFKQHRLKKFWMYRYSSQRHQGVQLHADAGAVNVNLWLAPDQANKNAASGGLRLFDVEAPLFENDADFHAFNHHPAQIQRYLIENKARAIDIPYRQNRLLIFNANLFHESLPYDFEADFASQRMNLTLMFGQRGQTGSGG
ncbi:MAG: hypothetical protein IGS03_09985 [Candidatus Sericytochromatia bacterium]|nr:hypothetical protein [Candidatus Sericytochromatia bacterium]